MHSFGVGSALSLCFIKKGEMGCNQYFSPHIHCLVTFSWLIVYLVRVYSDVLVASLPNNIKRAKPLNHQRRLRLIVYHVSHSGENNEANGYFS